MKLNRIAQRLAGALFAAGMSAQAADLTQPIAPADLVFEEVGGLVAIEVEARNASYSSRDGVLFDKAQHTLLQFPGGKGGAYTLPNSVTTVENGAFADCFKLTNVTLGNQVKSATISPRMG